MKLAQRTLGLWGWMVCGGLAASPAWAASSNDHSTNVGAGISAPSSTSAIYLNPAGLIYTDKQAINLRFWSTDESFNNNTGGASYLTGNRQMALNLGMDHSFAASGDNTILYGMALGLGQRGAFGAQGQTNLSGGTTFNLGLLINVSDKATLGIDAIDVSSSSRYYGVGAHLEIGSSAGLSVDAGMDHEFGNLWLNPGLMVGSADAALTVAYGLALSAGAASHPQIFEGISAGATLKMGASTRLGLYYKTIHQMMASLTVAL